MVNNYRLLISGIAPPAGWDTYRNLNETGECVINTVFENMIEAVSATFIDAPYGVSKWDISGLREAPSATVKLPPTRFRVKEGTGTANPQYSHIDLDNGISYGRVVSTFERPRVKWDDGVSRSALLAKLQAARSE
ncbi:hypothetical protein BDW72DRAFT_209031 [Aspergillus terricola var. indicus]